MDETRKSTMEDCMKCDEPPNCSTYPNPCNIVIEKNLSDKIRSITEIRNSRMTNNNYFVNTRAINKAISEIFISLIEDGYGLHGDSKAIIDKIKSKFGKELTK